MARWNTPEADKIMARKMFKEGQNPHQIAAELGYEHTTVRMWTDPEYAERRTKQTERNAQRYRDQNKAERMRQRRAKAKPSLPRVPM